MGKRSRRRRWVTIGGLIVYAALVVISHTTTRPSAQPPAKTDITQTAILPLRDSDGATTDDTIDIVLNLYSQGITPQERADDPERLPVVFLHGSPGSRSNFDWMTPHFVDDGRVTLAPDLPGYGESSMAPDLSHTAQSRVVFDTMDWASIERAHIVAWSSSGGVALRMIEQDPDRVASITMLAAIGAQYTEGSGSYFFEHVKYAIGLAVFGVLPECVPHFGTLGTFQSRAGWLKAFWDSDQRPLARIMEESTTPTLIIHGRDDPLIPDWGAEEHQRLMHTHAQLVMLDAMHFMPFTMPERTSELVIEFASRHDAPGVPPRTGVIDEAPIPETSGFASLLRTIGELLTRAPWYLEFTLVLLAARWNRWITALLAGVFIVQVTLDPYLVLFTMMLMPVLFARWRRDPYVHPWTWLGCVFESFVVIPVLLASVFWTLRVTNPLTDAIGMLGFVLAITIGTGALWVVHVLVLCVHERGRLRVKVSRQRLMNHEYWPTWALYTPTFIRFPFWALTRCGLRGFTACNPGYADDGGIIDERKSVLHARFDPDAAPLHLELIPDEPDGPEDHIPHARAQAATALVERIPELGGYPVIAKPDAGQHGIGVALIRTPSALRAYVDRHDEPVVLQRYHEGPCEFGVTWARDPSTLNTETHQGRTGEILGITIKELPTIIGDGSRTLRELILAHPRHRVMARVFFAAHREALREIPDLGEEIQLGEAANHAQGAVFRDGSHMITPELSDAIDAIASGFKDEHGRGFDIGRFDVRCASPEHLRRAKDLGIIELNGVVSEPAQLYDPDRSARWATLQLVTYWDRVTKLGAARVRSGTGSRTPWRSVLKKAFTNLDKFA